MILTDALGISDYVRLRHWPEHRYWYYNKEKKQFEIPGTEIVRTVLTVDQAFAVDWEPYHI